MDHTSIHPTSADVAHRVDLFCWQGAPLNNDENHPIQVLVNTGFVVGFCPSRLQPAWAAYRVAHADRDVDFDRPHLYYADQRISEAARLSGETFGRHDNIQYHVGHMAPNEAINRQFGRLAQMETFFMSNMSPQRGSLNTGVWLKLENAILGIEDTDEKDHVWAVIGPIFTDDPGVIDRDGGKRVPIPDAYYCITIDPFRYPFDRFNNVHMLCLRIPQDAAGGSSPGDFVTSLDALEAETRLTFFPRWARPRAAPGERSIVEEVTRPEEHRLLRAIRVGEILSP